MTFRQLLNHVVVRNLLGLLALVAVHYVSDQYHINQRLGVNQYLPYFFLLLLYGWLVVHNRLLFERLYLYNKPLAYAGWTLLIMAGFSVNMHLILSSQFAVRHTFPHIISFWVYTVAGLGVYVLYRYLQTPGHVLALPTTPRSTATSAEGSNLVCTVNGEKQSIPCADMLYLESLENYVKITTLTKVYVTRMTLKEAEERLPKPAFVRISRSHIVNTARIEKLGPDDVRIGGRELRIGKVYKRYVSEQMAGGEPG